MYLMGSIEIVASDALLEKMKFYFNFTSLRKNRLKRCILCMYLCIYASMYVKDTLKSMCTEMIKANTLCC